MQLLKAIEREKINLKINPQVGTHNPERIFQKEQYNDMAQIDFGKLIL